MKKKYRRIIFYGTVLLFLCGLVSFLSAGTMLVKVKAFETKNMHMPEEGDIEKAEQERTEAEKNLDGSLHAGAAVLFDMDSGRVLYEKNGSDILPMASTTKIMTCIVALESGYTEEIVTASAYAAAQPKVHLGMQKGMTYQMTDLLYSLMLESHNDSAVAIAEHIGSKGLQLPEPSERTKEQSREAVKAFCDEMTRKARELGCEDTCFLTPNGLDAEAESTDGEKIKHSTTAADLARIMDYCVTESECREKFLEITQMQTHSFLDVEGKRNYSCMNHNALLTMLEGVLAGKTGFTNQAGYCYVGALERDGKQLALALLACGWPGHKSWKWEDSRKLISYGLENYEYRDFLPEIEFSSIVVENGAAKSGNPWEQVSVVPKKEVGKISLRLLTRADENVKVDIRMEETIQAPIRQGKSVGQITYYLEDGNGKCHELGKENFYINEEIAEKDFRFVLHYIGRIFLL